MLLLCSDSPWSPSLQVFGDETESEVVTISCSAVTPCPHAPPELTWDLHQGTNNITETNSDGTFTTKITQNITLTDSHDGRHIKCNASYPVSGGFKMSNSDVTLSVSYGPKDTSVVVSPSGSLSSGQSVTLNCSSRAKPPVHHFTWFRHSSQGPVNVSEGQTYSFNICEGGEYYCVASNKHGNGSSPDIQLQITDAPGSPSLQVFGDQTESEVVTISCSAVTPCPHAPPELTWDLHQGTNNITETNSDGTFTTKITQNITLTDSDDGRIIKCSAAFPVTGGVKTTESTTTLNVTYGPKDTSVVVSPSGSLSSGQSVTLSCSSRAKPPVHHFTWFRHSSQGPVNVSEGQTYSFNFTEKGEYYCVASNTLGNESSAVITLNIKDSPWSPSLQVFGDETESEVVTISCSAVTPCPHAPPELTWDLHQGTNNITETNSDGTFTTKITQNITLTDSHDGRHIKCNASYPVSGGFKMSNSDVTLSVSYGPKDTSVVVSPSGSLSSGQSVTLSCSSRAKPPVHHFTWFRHSSQGPVNVSEGQTYSFNFTEKGEYYCVASNTLGNESSAVIQLRTEGAVVTGIGPYNIVKLCGIVLLYLSLVFIEW
ncbi:B-cell receptor CD22-like [Eucyclogobius newberryi]|uniref:B-cell receptor CD22-like n=1 Tax=Eucyclogobius newberryi TaxID=166745 RepID=UPI003B5B3C6D